MFIGERMIPLYFSSILSRNSMRRSLYVAPITWRIRKDIRTRRVSGYHKFDQSLRLDLHSSCRWLRTWQWGKWLQSGPWQCFSIPKKQGMITRKRKKNNRIETEKKTKNAKKTDYYKIFSILRKIIMIFHNLCLFLKTFYWGIVRRMVFDLFIVETE